MLRGERRLERRSVWHPADLCISTQEGGKDSEDSKGVQCFNHNKVPESSSVSKASLNSELWQRESEVARGEERHAI